MSTPATPTSCDILVFGGTGDLALHKLLPALYRLHREDRLPADTRIFALARSALDNAAFLALAERNVRAVVARSEFAAEQWKASPRASTTWPWTPRRAPTSAVSRGT